MSASNPLQLTRRNLLKLGGMVMVSSVAAAGLVAESTGTAPAKHAPDRSIDEHKARTSGPAVNGCPA